jgi:hypothetical protein
MRKKIFLFSVGLILKLVYVPLLCFPQLMTNANVAITMTSGVQLTVKGDIVNQAGTTINNSGTIDFTGNWTNNSGNNCFGTSTGTATMNGANQNIGGSNSTVFNNLNIQGSGTKTLLINTSVGGGNATPAGVLSLTAGVINLNSKTLFVTNPNTTAVTSAAGSILSEMQDNSSKVDWNIQNSAGLHTIPFSNNSGTSIPFTYNQTSGTAGHAVVSTYAANAANAPYPSAPNSVVSISTLGDGITSYMVHRYWEVDVDDTSAVSAFTFTFDPATEAPLVSGTMYAQQWNDTSIWNIPVPTQSNPTSYSVLLMNNRQYGTYGIASGASPLPMTLIRFTAKLNSSKQVDINWTTASEVNNDYFSVQRSSNGFDFETISKTEGAGNSTTMLHYYSVDKKPLHGISYYRLMQTDFDGTNTFSQIVPVNNSSSYNEDVIIYPNPVTEYALIALNSTVANASTISFELFDMLGKKIIGSKLSELTSISDNVFRLDRNNLAQGTYFYRLTSDNDRMWEGKLIVE